MILDRIAQNRWWLGGALLAAVLLGALLFALLQALLPGRVGERARVEQVVREYILANPEILPEAMAKLREREAEKAQAEATKFLAADKGSVARPYSGAWMGNPNGDVTVVAFLDYNCGYCRSNIPAIAQLIASDSKVRVIYREYPVLGEESVLAARWALAAAEQGKFKAFHETLYGSGRATEETIAAAADTAGVDKALAAKAIESRAIEDEIGGNYSFGRALQMAGTPGWVIGKRIYQGALSYEDLVNAVAEARKAG